MKTLEEIKALVYPTEKVDWVIILKDLLSHKTKNGELVTFSGIYLYDIGDPDLYVKGVSLVNGNIIVVAEMVYGGDVDATFIGTISDEFDEEKGIELTDEAIKKICKTIFEKKYNIDFDFSSMKPMDNYHFGGDYFKECLEERKKFKKAIEGFINGAKVGYVEW